MHTLRLLRLFVILLLRGRSPDVLVPVTHRFRVTPFDVELTHASSHAYMAWAGLGRWSWTLAYIDLRRMLRERWTPFTHSELVYYRRALRLFSAVEVTTTLIWWDAKMAYFEHRMTQAGQVAAIVYSRGAYYAGGQRIPMDRCAQNVPSEPPMAVPEIVGVWTAADAQFKRSVAPPAA